jgi:hypothetical protein
MAELTQNEISDGVDGYVTFRASAGNAFGPYCTPAVEDQNCSTLTTWIKENLPGGLIATVQVGSWQIALRACLKLGTLVKDPTWIGFADRLAIFQKFYNSLSVDQVKYINEGYTPNRLSDEQQQWFAIIGGPAGYKQLQNTENEIEQRKQEVAKKTQQQLQQEAFEKDGKR